VIESVVWWVERFGERAVLGGEWGGKIPIEYFGSDE
jgi:hypothetical protein